VNDMTSDELLVRPGTLLAGQHILEWVPADQPTLVHIAVAFAGRLLVDLGAQVVRVQPDNDPLIHLRSDPSETLGTTSLLAEYLNRGKAVVDGAHVNTVANECSIALLGAPNLLSDHADALSCVEVSAFSEGMRSNGLDEEIGSGSIAVSELGLQGLVGLTDLFGEPDQQPLMMGGHQTAYTTGFSLFCAAMAALAKHQFHGKIDSAQVSAVDALAWVNWKGIAAGTLGFPVARGGRKAEAPVLQCRDGHFAFLHLANNWQAIHEAVNDPRLDDEQFSRPGRRAKNAAALNQILGDWVKNKSRAELFEFCQQHAIPGGPILDGADLLQDTLYLHRGFFETHSCSLNDSTSTSETGVVSEIRVPGVPLTIESAGSPVTDDNRNTAGASTASELRDALLASGSKQPADLPLAGMLVVDLGIFTAGSVTSTLLADLGARVIKVESESYSDPFRLWPGIKGDSPLFTFNNRNKLGVNIDLKSVEGKANFLKLVGQADVVVENFRRGVLSRLGIDFPVLQAANPAISLVSISGQGASGPGSGHVSFGSTLEALGGVAALTGYPGGSCYISGRNLNYPDQIVCLYGAGAAIAALMKARELGVGLHIDVSQREVTTLAVGEKIAAASLATDHREDHAVKRKFPGNSDINAALQDIFAAADGWLCVTVADESQLLTLATFLGCTRMQVEDYLPSWLAERSRDEAIAALRSLGLSVFKANTGTEAAQEPAVAEGSAFSKTASGAMVKGFPFQFRNAPLGIYDESPGMGEHTERIMRLLDN